MTSRVVVAIFAGVFSVARERREVHVAMEGGRRKISLKDLVKTVAFPLG